MARRVAFVAVPLFRAGKFRSDPSDRKTAQSSIGEANASVKQIRSHPHITQVSIPIRSQVRPAPLRSIQRRIRAGHGMDRSFRRT